MRRHLVLAFFLCFAATAGFAQSRLDGKWRTERPAEPQTLNGQRIQSVELDLTIEDGRASGSLSIGGLGGTFDTFKDGKVSGDKVQFRTVVSYSDTKATTIWSIETVDENTITLGREPVEMDWLIANRPDLNPSLGRPLSPPVQVTTVTVSPLVSGIVQDRSKARIPGVSIAAINVSTGASITTTTDQAGAYSFPSLMPGKYTLTASLPGFKTSTISDLSIGDTQLVWDFTLEVLSRPSGNPPVAECTPNSNPWCRVLHRVR